MKKIILSVVLGFMFLATALSQGAQVLCSDRPLTDRSNACANTRFVWGLIIQQISALFPLSYSTRTALAAVSGPTNGRVAYLSENIRQGLFAFATTNLATAVTNDVGQCVFVPPSTDTSGASGAWVRTQWPTISSGRSTVNAQWCGADPSGTLDSVTPFNNAFSVFGTAGNTGGAVYAPSGVYKIVACVGNKAIKIGRSRQVLYGDGKFATQFDFEPTVSCTLFHVENSDGVSPIANMQIRELSYFSHDTTQIKIGIHIIDGSDTQVINSGTMTPHLFGAGSIPLQINGRDIGTYSDLTLFGDFPLVLGPIPAPHTPGGIGIDQHNFFNQYYFTSTTNPLITVQDGTTLTSVHWNGYQAWVGGGIGFYLNAPTTADVSSNITFENIRTENTTNAPSYAFYFDYPSSQIQGISIRNSTIGDRKGYYVRSAANLTVEGLQYTIASEAANIDGTVIGFSTLNSFYQTSSTKTLTGQTLMSSTPAINSGAFPQNAVYQNVTAIDPGQSVGQVLTSQNYPGIAAAGTATLTPVVGTLVLGVSTGFSCTFKLRGANHTTALTDSDGGACSVTDGAVSHNVIYKGGNYIIQNGTAGLSSYYATLIGQYQP